MAIDQHPICDYEGSSYQEDFWEGANRAYEDLCEEHALQRLLPKSGDLLLELGAGAGRNTARYTGFARIVLLDYSVSQLQRAQARLGISDRYLYVAANIYSLPFGTGLFDAATMIRTLHHMADPKAALQEVRRVMTDNSTFILEYANKRNLKAILRYFFRRQKWNPFSWEPVEYTELNYDFHPRAVQSWLGDSGFRSIRKITVSHFRVPFLKRLFPPAWLAFADSVLGRTGNLAQWTPSVFVLAHALPGTAAKAESFFWCPNCHSDRMKEVKAEASPVLMCLGCGNQYRIQGGIYNFKEPLRP